MRYANPPELGPLEGARELARRSLRELIDGERSRARAHIAWIRRGEPEASPDRIARVVVERWTKVASVEGGLTGALGLIGVPLNTVLFVYSEVAVVVTIAEAYGVLLEGEPGEAEVLAVLEAAHGIDDLRRAGPRVLGALAKTLALRHGLPMLGRLVPLVASPIAARLNASDMAKLARAALQRFGGVVEV